MDNMNFTDDFCNGSKLQDLSGAAQLWGRLEFISLHIGKDIWRAHKNALCCVFYHLLSLRFFSQNIAKDFLGARSTELCHWGCVQHKLIQIFGWAVPQTLLLLLEMGYMLGYRLGFRDHLICIRPAGRLWAEPFVCCQGSKRSRQGPHGAFGVCCELWGGMSLWKCCWWEWHTGLAITPTLSSVLQGDCGKGWAGHSGHCQEGAVLGFHCWVTECGEMWKSWCCGGQDIHRISGKLRLSLNVTGLLRELFTPLLATKKKWSCGKCFWKHSSLCTKRKGLADHRWFGLHFQKSLF